MSYFGDFVETHVGLLSFLCSICMLIVTAIYAVITWWQAKYSKQTLLASVKQYREEKQPYIVLSIEDVSGCAFDTSTYLRIQFSFHYSLENVGDSSAVTLYSFLYAKPQNQKETKLIYAHLMPEYLHSLRVGQKAEERLHFETNEFREIIEDLEISHVKNEKRIETDPSVTPYLGPIIMLRCLYMNMTGQWFESVLEQELNSVFKKEIKEEKKEDAKDHEEDELEVTDKRAGRVTNNNVTDGDVFEGGMISPGYSKMSRRMVDNEYVSKILDECREFSDSKLEYLRA